MSLDTTHMLFKFTTKEDTNIHIVHIVIQYHGWWLGESTSQVISGHGIDVYPEKCSFSPFFLPYPCQRYLLLEAMSPYNNVLQWLTNNIQRQVTKHGGAKAIIMMMWYS